LALLASQLAAQPVSDQGDLREQRIKFATQELIPAERNGWLFQLDSPPRIIWRDLELVSLLGFRQPLKVRWFDSELVEHRQPGHAGRWIAWVEGVAPNGHPFRRSLTFCAMPGSIAENYVPDLTIELPNFPGPTPPPLVLEHQSEIVSAVRDAVPLALLDTERTAIVAAGLTEMKPLGRPARFTETFAVRNEDLHLELKLKLLRPRHAVKALEPPLPLQSMALGIRSGTIDRANVKPDAKAKIDEVCRQWAEESGEPFVTLVARNGSVITHEAFGRDRTGSTISRDQRFWVASITKTITALLFSQFVDQGRLTLDDSLAVAFPDYPETDPRVPTFCQCLNHTSGLSGKNNFGGMRNPNLENVVLNLIDINQPAVKYEYSGLGFELVAKAMEMLTGRSAVRLYHEHLFQPLGLGDVPIDNASSDGQFTAKELAILGQLIANRGSYEGLQFFRAATFDQLLPRPLTVPDRGATNDEGIGLHWIRHYRSKTAGQGTQELVFSESTVGHGSFSGCIFIVDLQQQLVITQVRKQTGPGYAEWSSRFFETIADALEN